MKKAMVATLVLIASSVIAAELGGDCVKIKNDADRLACYDQLVMLVKQLKSNEEKSSEGKEVTGAFGIRFSDTFEPKDAKSIQELNNGEKRYEITPVTPNDLFDKYYVGVTPKTHRVFTIKATSKPTAEIICDNQELALHNKLKEKYAPNYKSDKYDKSLHLKKSSIFLYCDDNFDGTSVLRIIYSNHKTEEINKQEAAELEGKAINAAGL